jgi:hypothetical protein
MRMNRRNAMKAAGAGIATTLAGLAIAETSKASPVRDMIDRHRQLHDANNQAWDEVSRIVDAYSGRWPRPAVQYGRLVIGVDNAGNNLYQPMMAYSHAMLEERKQQELRNLVSIFGEKARAKTEERYDRLAADLTKQDQELEAMNEATGLSAAEAAAEACSEAMDECLAEIISYRCTSIAEAQEIAAYIHAHVESDTGNVTDEMVLEFVKNLGGAGVAS